MSTSEESPSQGVGRSRRARTTPARTTRPALSQAFTLIEVLLALSLAVGLSLSLMPVWHALEQSQVRAGDRTIALLQGRLAAARFEKDLRAAASGADTRGSCAAVVRAEAHEVVFLMSGPRGIELVEWEFAGGRLMRRSASWSGVLPPTISHSIYTDNKTMLEGVASGEFRYEAGGQLLSAVTPAGHAWLSGVVIRATLRPSSGGTVPLLSRARVGR
jgi:hypothetical protein